MGPSIPGVPKKALGTALMWQLIIIKSFPTRRWTYWYMIGYTVVLKHTSSPDDEKHYVMAYCSTVVQPVRQQWSYQSYSMPWIFAVGTSQWLRITETRAVIVCGKGFAITSYRWARWLCSVLKELQATTVKSQRLGPHLNIKTVFRVWDSH